MKTVMTIDGDDDNAVMCSNGADFGMFLAMYTIYPISANIFEEHNNTTQHTPTLLIIEIIEVALHGHSDVSIHKQLDCLFNNVYTVTTLKIPELYISAYVRGNHRSLIKASERESIWISCHHINTYLG